MDTTLNVMSLMGAVMLAGVAMSNSNEESSPHQAVHQLCWHQTCWLPRMLRFIVVVIFAGSLCAQSAIEFEGRYWFSNVKSQIRVERNGLGTDIDANKDLGFSDTGFPGGRVSLNLGRHRLAFDYTPIDLSGDQIVTRTLNFNGNTYTLGTRVISGLEVRHLQFGWTYQFSLLEGRIKFGPLVEAQGFLLRGRLRAPDVNVDSNDNLSVGLSTVGPTLSISPVRQIEIYGEASGMSVGDYGQFVRSEAGVRFRPLRQLHLTFGYRTFNLNVYNSADFATLHLRGPFLGAGFGW